VAWGGLERTDGGYRLGMTLFVVAVAAPVHDHRRRVIAAVSIAGSAHRLDLERLAPAVRTAALALSREMASR